MFAKCYWRAWSRSVDAMQFAAVSDNLKFAIVKKKFEEHCIPKQNELIARDRFNARTQKIGESGIQYESCNFGIQEDSIIRDQLVRGMLPDEKLKDKLYEEDDLNLEKAIIIKIITTHEIRATMTSAASMDAVYHQGRGRGRSHGSSRGRGSSRGSSRGRGRGSSRGRGRGSSEEVGQSRGASATNSQPCNNCGHVVHNSNDCPATEVTCFHCKKKGHYARKCKSHNAHEVEVEEVEEMYDHFYIETISLNPPNVDAHVNNIKSCEQQKEKRVPLSVEGEKIQKSM